MKGSAGGFTLMELLVVLAIFAVLSVMAYGGLSSVLTSRARVAEALERTAALEKGYVRVRNDFQQLRARPARDNNGELQPALLAMADGTVEFTRSGWRNPLSLPRSALERVAYRLDDRQRLVRVSWRVLDRAQSSEPVELPVLEQVEQMKWRFLDAKAAWQEAWPMGGMGQNAPLDTTPIAVELTLVLKDLGEVRWLFEATNNAVPKPALPQP